MICVTPGLVVIIDSIDQLGMGKGRKGNNRGKGREKQRTVKVIKYYYSLVKVLFVNYNRVNFTELV